MNGIKYKIKIKITQCCFIIKNIKFILLKLKNLSAAVTENLIKILYNYKVQQKVKLTFFALSKSQFLAEVALVSVSIVVKVFKGINSKDVRMTITQSCTVTNGFTRSNLFYSFNNNIIIKLNYTEVIPNCKTC